MCNCSQGHGRLARHRVTVMPSNNSRRHEQAMMSDLAVTQSTFTCLRQRRFFSCSARKTFAPGIDIAPLEYFIHHWTVGARLPSATNDDDLPILRVFDSAEELFLTDTVVGADLIERMCSVEEVLQWDSVPPGRFACSYRGPVCRCKIDTVDLTVCSPQEACSHSIPMDPI